MEILSVINDMDEIIDNIYSDDAQLYMKINNIVRSISDLIYEFMNLIPSLNEIGMNISEDDILSQIKKLMYGIEKKDKVVIYDSIGFEIRDTLIFYNEIKKIMSGE